jgi:hypothetical protein
VTGTLPKEDDIRLILAEDVRIEQNSKFTLLGWYLGNKIKVADVGAQFSIPLTFLITVDGGEGEYDMRLEMKTPSGKSMFVDTQKMPKLRDTAAVHVIKILGFPLAEMGRYEIEMSLDGQIFRPAFSITYDPTLKLS